MKSKKSLLLHILFLSIAIYYPVAALAGPAEQAAVDEFMATRGLPSSMAVIVTDLSTGKTVASASEEKSLVPASILKTVTIASMLQKSGPEAVLVTPVYIDGPIHKHTLEGNLQIVGAGDPSLNSSAEPKTADFVQEIITALKKEGIEKITGRIIIDQSIFKGPATPPSWASGDLPHAYGTGQHGFNFANNASGKSSVSNPASVFESKLKSALAAADITIEGNSVKSEDSRLLMAHQSAPIAEIMRSCMMRSDNLFAESLLRLFAIENGKDGSTATGAEEEMKFLNKQKIPMHDVNIVDGSGLSRSNRVTAKMIDAVLQNMADDVDYASFFPLAGQEGTLRKFLADTPLDSYIAMKTGSMSGIQCYAGYKLDEDFAPTHTVVVIVNDFRCDRATVKAAVQKMLLQIFRNSE